ncbi:cytosolic factor, phosphatidylinositol/phosphatidylcholine transfer protein [Saxophila tyrrhenica]|uniref:Cytosolic factor, phosphatidylinositol/phosphatidylcholine transfer protein n=1 Tax=Saxophila tyrrhenica TaxID=1690608 RepID=A0AAV9PGR3_9PEZI|nr:cytosolic factor, phosphatidylinositol/phosphatidylcholine transfer protein [Saxophila tyrrhenica]
MASNPQMELDPKYDHYDFPTTAPESKSGHPGHTTKEQDAAVHQLRMTLEQAGYHDRLDTLSMLRFLRARKFNVELAKQMFVDCEKWRSEFGGGVDNLVRTFEYKEKEQMMQYYPQYYHKTDKEGRPVYIEGLGKVDLEAMRKITTDERMLENLVCEYEKMVDPRLPACSRKAGQLLETCCTIMDLKGVGLWKAKDVYGYVQRASAISQNYYPERLGKLYVINAPWGFSGVFSVVKKFLDPVTVAKIHVLGAGYQKELLEQVPAENLPKEYGGKCECPGGCQLSDNGPWRDPAWAKPPAWAKKSEKNTIPATESHTGEGNPTGVEGQTGEAPTQTQSAGQPAPAPQ